MIFLIVVLFLQQMKGGVSWPFTTPQESYGKGGDPYFVRLRDREEALVCLVSVGLTWKESVCPLLCWAQRRAVWRRTRSPLSLMQETGPWERIPTSPCTRSATRFQRRSAPFQGKWGTFSASSMGATTRVARHSGDRKGLGLPGATISDQDNANGQSVGPEPCVPAIFLHKTGYCNGKKSMVK